MIYLRLDISLITSGYIGSMPKQACKAEDGNGRKFCLSSNKIRSMHFEFDMTTQWRVIKNLTVVGDATHEALTIVSEASADFK
jgi:hypothetical protein